MIKNKKILYLMLILLVVGLVLWYFNKIIKETRQTPEPIFSEQTKFSRITFFNTHKIKAGLEIPEEWEGNYRVVENGNTVKFMSILDPAAPRELFLIRLFSSIEWEKENTGWTFLAEKNGSIFAYQLSTSIKAGNENDKKYNKTLLQSTEILKRFDAG